MSDLTTVDFHGAKLVAVKGNTPAETLVAMKPIVEGMGLDWSSQHAKVMRHPVLSKGIQHIAIPSAGGVQETTAIPLNRLSLWLATVHPDKVRADVRDVVIQYQEECADVLFAHFFAKAGGAVSAGMDARTVGMMKMVAHKVTGTEKMLALMANAMAEQDRRINELIMKADGRVAALERISVRRLLDEAGAVSKGRKSLNQRVRYALMKLAAIGNVQGVTDCPHTGVALFPIDFAREFMRATGNGWVRQHNAVQQGQGVIKFPARRRKLRKVEDQPSA
ncbi:MAG: phage antirepressor N-terminal domain-containing protein [Alphaproteobacteria bacterium]